MRTFVIAAFVVASIGPSAAQEWYPRNYMGNSDDTMHPYYRNGQQEDAPMVRPRDEFDGPGRRPESFGLYPHYQHSGPSYGLHPRYTPNYGLDR